MRPVYTWQEIESNLLTLDRLRNSTKHFEEYVGLMKLGRCFVVWSTKGRLYFGPSRFVGYLDNSVPAHERNSDKHGGRTNKAINSIMGAKPASNEALEKAYLNFCETIGVQAGKPAFGGSRKYWFKGEDGNQYDHVGYSDVAADIKSVINMDVPLTEKESLVTSRVGQGQFRAELISHWNGCSVTGCKVFEVLRASHIKPWCDSSPEERLDKYNGLLLVPNLDSAFDKGYITFNDDGRILISSVLSSGDIKLLGIKTEMTIELKPRHKKYLRYHRDNVFRG